MLEHQVSGGPRWWRSRLPLRVNLRLDPPYGMSVVPSGADIVMLYDQVRSAPIAEVVATLLIPASRPSRYLVRLIHTYVGPPTKLRCSRRLFPCKRALSNA